MNVEPCLFHDVLIRDAVACRRALSRLGIALAAPDLHGFISDGTRCRHLMTRADAFEIAPLESPANRGTAIMQGAIPVKSQNQDIPQDNHQA